MNKLQFGRTRLTKVHLWCIVYVAAVVLFLVVFPNP